MKFTTNQKIKMVEIAMIGISHNIIHGTTDKKYDLAEIYSEIKNVVIHDDSKDKAKN